jgi:putative DNA methylase
LPLEDINREAAREKSIRHGHPSTLHLWWARRPLAACRAVLFASLVDDPEAEDADAKFAAACEQLNYTSHGTSPRERLFSLIAGLVKWENSTNETILNTARELIQICTGGNPPPVYDPFCGGGSIPLEAQRLGLVAHASDLNPVAVLITKGLIEIPPKFAGKPSVNPESRRKLDASGSWKGAAGLAEDIRYYGQWMRDEAEKRIGHLYPKGEAAQGTRWRRSDGDCMAVGAHCGQPQPGGQSRAFDAPPIHGDSTLRHDEASSFVQRPPTGHSHGIV